MKVSRSDRLTIVIGVLIVVVYTLLAAFTITQECNHIDKTYEADLNNVVGVIANDNGLIDKLILDNVSVTSEVEEYLVSVKSITFIEIWDVDSIRYKTGEMSLIGTSDVYAGDNYTVIDGVVRVHHELFDGSEQVGLVSVGIDSSDIKQVKIEKATTILLGFGFGLVFSLIALILLRKRFITALYGFSPSEIAILYAENKSIIEQLDEAVISIDKLYNITTINNTSKKMFKLDESAIGKKVQDIFPFVDFVDIIENNQHIINKYKIIEEQKLLMNAFPLFLDDEIIGASAVFRSHLEVDKLLDQINGYQQIAKALRSQKHEFQNKLHVVLGLIKMKDYEKAENYIMENVYTTNLASDYYSSRIKDDRILALFVGKEIQSKEYNASLLLTSDSYLTKTHNPVNSDDIVLVLGNLIDNSFEAYINKDMEVKNIVVDIFEDEDKVKITVIDQAGGIDEDLKDHIFERGISSKNGDSRGTGLSLVNEMVTVYNGEKNVSSTVEETKIEIILMKVSL